MFEEETYSECNSLAEQKLPVLCTLCRKEGYGNKQRACPTQRSFDIAHVEDATDDKARNEYESILEKVELG